MENSSRLYRSQHDKMIGGVCGGLADYFNVDIALIRIAFVLLLVFGGGGFLAYVILWIVIPAAPLGFTRAVNTDKGFDKKDNKQDIETGVNNRNKNNTSLIAGIVLILIGLIILFDRIFPFYDIIDFWPLVLIFLGIALIKPEIFKSAEPKKEVADTIVVEETKPEEESK